MKWTLGLLLLSAVGCGYRQTKMVACPETGCPPTYASSSPEGLVGPNEVPAVVPMPGETPPPPAPEPIVPEPTPAP